MKKLEALAVMGEGEKIFESNILPSKDSYLFWNVSTQNVDVHVPDKFKPKVPQYLQAFHYGIMEEGDEGESLIEFNFVKYEGAIEVPCTTYVCTETGKYDVPANFDFKYFAVSGDVKSCEAGSQLHELFVNNPKGFRKCSPISEEDHLVNKL